MRRYYAYVTVNYKVSNLSATLGLCATLFVLSAPLVSSHLYGASGWWLSCRFNANLVSTCVIPELPFTLKICNFLDGPGIMIGRHNYVLSGKIPCPCPFVRSFECKNRSLVAVIHSLVCWMLVSSQSHKHFSTTVASAHLCHIRWNLEFQNSRSSCYCTI